MIGTWDGNQSLLGIVHVLHRKMKTIAICFQKQSNLEHYQEDLEGDLWNLLHLSLQRFNRNNFSFYHFPSHWVATHEPFEYFLHLIFFSTKVRLMSEEEHF